MMGLETSRKIKTSFKFKIPDDPEVKAKNEQPMKKFNDLWTDPYSVEGRLHKGNTRVTFMFKGGDYRCFGLNEDTGTATELFAHDERYDAYFCKVFRNNKVDESLLYIGFGLHQDKEDIKFNQSGMGHDEYSLDTLDLN